MVSPIIIAGPTASGKSSLALQMAKEMQGEIVCADSRQVYAHMNIGTAGPTEEEIKQIPHHGFGAIDPDENYDAGRFVVDADGYIAEILSRGKVPILVGGTGLYLRSFRFGMSDVPSRDEEIRRQIELEKNAFGLDAMHKKLQTIDIESANKIMPNDEVRIERALEIFQLTGKKPSELRKSHAAVSPRLEAKWLLLWPKREILWSNIEKRVRHMFDNGLVEEALALKNRVKLKTTILQTMGYEEALLLADGFLSKEEAIEKTCIRHRQYAKRQMTWFKKEIWWEKI